jgi:hypothetical protein
MWLASGINATDIDDPRPRTVIAGRIEADNLGAPFKLGCLMMMQVLEPDAPVSIGTLYILDDGGDVAIVRLQGESPDLWIVDRFSGDGGLHRCALARRRWSASGTHGSITSTVQLSPGQKPGLFLCGRAFTSPALAQCFSMPSRLLPWHSRIVSEGIEIWKI